MGVVSIKDRLRGKQENARVPQKIPCLQHRGRGRAVRLFDKARKGLRGFGCGVCIRGKLKITIARFGPRGRDAECDQITSLCPRNGRLHRLGKGITIGDHMVRRGHQHQRLRISLCDV